MSTLETFERQFVQAVNPRTRNYSLAHTVIADMRTANACDAFIALHEAHLLDLEDPSRKDDALIIVMERCVRAGDVEPALQARCIVKATQLAMLLNERAVMRELRGVAAVLFARYSTDRKVTFWQAAVDLNVGLHAYFNGKHDEALQQLDVMVTRFSGDRAYDCWLTEANAYRAMILAHMRLFAEAAASLKDAEGTSSSPHDKPVLFLAEAEIAAHRGDTQTARDLFWQAYKAANALTPRRTRIIELALMRYAQLAKESDTHSCELACALLHEINGNNGMPHVRDALDVLTCPSE